MRATPLFLMTPKLLSHPSEGASVQLLPGNLLIVSGGWWICLCLPAPGCPGHPLSRPLPRQPLGLPLSLCLSGCTVASLHLLGTAPYLPGFAKAYYVWN